MAHRDWMAERREELRGFLHLNDTMTAKPRLRVKADKNLLYKYIYTTAAAAAAAVSLSFMCHAINFLAPFQN